MNPHEGQADEGGCGGVQQQQEQDGRVWDSGVVGGQTLKPGRTVKQAGRRRLRVPPNQNLNYLFENK
jgi:hypothetical protein